MISDVIKSLFVDVHPGRSIFKYISRVEWMLQVSLHVYYIYILRDIPHSPEKYRTVLYCSDAILAISVALIREVKKNDNVTPL